MIISSSKNFIYIKGHKVAGTSVERFFQNLCDKDTDIIGYRGKHPIPEHIVYYNHMRPLEIKRKLEYEQWDNSFKFACVRNPWDRVVSAYFFEKNNLSHSMSFEQYCRNINMPNMYDFYQLYDVSLDYLISYENLLTDVQTVCNILGLTFDKDTFPHDKKGDRNSDYKVYYNQTTRKLIKDKYVKDIEYFKYRFD